MSLGELQIWPSILDLVHSLIRLRAFRLAIAGWHFQVDAVSLVHDHIWDGTSLLLRKGIRRYARDGYRVLDLGTGHLGLLAVYCARTYEVRTVAVDINDEFVANARIVAMASHVPEIVFKQSDWFSNVDGTFDVIFGNVPYVPTECSTNANSREHPEIWQGGKDGSSHVRCILQQVADYLKPHGLLLLGINTRYLPRTSTMGLIETSQELELRTIVESWISRNEIYVLGLKHPIYERLHETPGIRAECPESFSRPHIWDAHFMIPTSKPLSAWIKYWPANSRVHELNH
ncbi:methyltransferase [Desulfomonile tiedjei]|uniref:Methyltransferase family protein n=1 Tax=Desulfomonile tiedjei (strain ATCC 49306 / DSM 6799 / DCB-1) TaxID=706587 RepID=I4C692_DESTA|nr:class I SAM-dependent methyltransferase [Desulfomonile tiedjei]AFM25083.1 methyltransferase family protein [Desulfomonile tiedjei DSM 6799]